MVNKVKVVHGDDLLYRFFQYALKKEPELFAKVPRMMLEAMGIWFPRATYRVFPVLLPWVVRDASCRGNKLKGIPDMWGAPRRWVLTDAGQTMTEEYVRRPSSKNL